MAEQPDSEFLFCEWKAFSGYSQAQNPKLMLSDAV